MQDPLPVGTLIDGRYRLVRMLRKGGMGEIYAGEHVHTHRRVAIKILREPWSRDHVTRERFKREAQATSKIVHEHIVEMLDFGVTADGVCYLVMELLYGEDLQATLDREGRLPLRRAAKIMLQICSALGEAHRHRIIHRDLKPGNCFRTGFRDVQDFIKLVDFGIAKELPREDDDGAETSALTTQGTILGTIFYMAPEQTTGGPIDHRIDVYAAGVLLFQLVTGKLPFRGRTPAETFRQILTADVPSARKLAPAAELPLAIEEVFRKALHKKPERRYGSMDELGAAIAALIAHAPKDRKLDSTALSNKLAAVASAATRPIEGRGGVRLALGASLAAALATATALALCQVARADAVVYDDERFEEVPTKIVVRGVAELGDVALVVYPYPCAVGGAFSELEAALPLDPDARLPGREEDERGYLVVREGEAFDSASSYEGPLHNCFFFGLPRAAFPEQGGAIPRLDALADGARWALLSRDPGVLRTGVPLALDGLVRRSAAPPREREVAYAARLADGRLAVEAVQWTWRRADGTTQVEDPRKLSTRRLYAIEPHADRSDDEEAAWFAGGLVKGATPTGPGGQDLAATTGLEGPAEARAPTQAASDQAEQTGPEGQVEPAPAPLAEPIVGTGPGGQVAAAGGPEASSAPPEPEREPGASDGAAADSWDRGLVYAALCLAVAAGAGLLLRRGRADARGG